MKTKYTRPGKWVLGYALQNIPPEKNGVSLKIVRLTGEDPSGTALKHLQRVVRPLTKRELAYAFILEHKFPTRGKAFALKRAYAGKDILRISDPKECFDDH